jgi:hypothetical protein
MKKMFYFVFIVISRVIEIKWPTNSIGGQLRVRSRLIKLSFKSKVIVTNM